MSQKSAFNQNQVAENAYVEPSGVLDQLNLPPSVVRFVRNYKRIIQVVAVVVVLTVVIGALYNSYRNNRIEKSTNNLAISLEASDDEKIMALEDVIVEHSGTPAALWATVELGHIAMKDNLFDKAETYYSSVLGKVSESNPMYGLLIFAVAQSQEAGKKYDKAFQSYKLLKEVAGYRDEGFMGMGRVLEAENKGDEALAVYEEYLGTLLGEKENPQLTRMIHEKITRLNTTE